MTPTALDPSRTDSHQAESDVGLHASIQAGKEQLMAAQRQLVELHNQHQAALVKELQARICASGFDYVSILEALLPSAWILCRRKGKTYTQRRGPRWQLKGQPACTYTQGRFSRVLQQHMRAHGLDPEVQADRRYFLANFMERI